MPNKLQTSCDDGAFGPTVSETCRGGFDFTVMFEETIMSILPSAIFIFVASIQAARMLVKRTKVVKNSSLFVAKIAACLIYAALQLVLLVLSAKNETSASSTVAIASSVLGLCAAFGLTLVLPLHHKASPRSSFIVSGFLFLSLLFDSVRVRTAWLIGGVDAFAATLSASIAIKLGILIIEAISKRSILQDDYSHLSKEATSGIFSRGSFWWLVSLLRDGSKGALQLSSLFAIHERLDSKRLSEGLSNQWNKANQDHRHSLARAAFWTWRYEIFKVFFPRLLVVGFSISQPFVIERVVENLMAPATAHNEGIGLIGAVAIVYTGTAVCTGFYEHLAFRLMAMIRGGLSSIVYEKLTLSTLQSVKASDSAVMTLIGTDVERICETWNLVVSETWASVLQLSLAIWLLERQLGVACIAPVLLALISTAISFKSGSMVAGRQKTWLEAVQNRVNFTSKVLSGIKSVKMLGLTGSMQEAIRLLRSKEIDLAKRYRRLSSFNVCLVNLPNVLSQVATFAAFAIVFKVRGDSEGFNISVAISSLSILVLLMSPLGMLLVTIPLIFTGLGCFERIETFLKAESWKEIRALENSGSSAPSSSAEASAEASATLQNENNTGAVSSSSNIINSASLASIDGQNYAIVVNNASFGWNHSTAVLKDVNITISKEDWLTLIVGPVGCGKSSLLKSLLGETILINGSIWLSSDKVSFCDQSPWISSGTIRECIIGVLTFSPDLYKAVVHACALDIDFQLFANGDQTSVGSQGLSLSGGQKQRLAIARALYSRRPIAVLDDVVSALDAVTQEAVLTRVFGPSGLLRKLGINAILATSSTKRLNIADKIIVLNKDGRIIKQGPTEQLSDVEHDVDTDPGLAQHPPAELASDYVSNAARRAEEAMQADRQIGDLEVYKYYFASLGWVGFSIFALCVASDGAFTSMQNVWLKLWAESESRFNFSYWLSIYALWAVGRAVCLVVAVYYLYVVIVPRSAKHLHQQVLQTALRAPMDFFTKTETGVLVNRFSQDMQLVDMILPGALVNTSFHVIACIGASILTIVATPYFAAIIPVLVGILYGIQRFYLQTSRQLRLLELESKAPMFSHMIDTANGISSIRAFGLRENYINDYRHLLNNCQKPFYLLLCIQRWLTVVLGLIVAVLATLLTALAVNLRGSAISGGFVGIALVNMMSLSHSLASLIIFWTSLETSLGAVSRIKTFSEDTPQEPDSQENPPANWPSTGSLVFNGWTAAYSDTTILQNITLSIQHGEKVAICGRTGSGKSTLITSVLGMMNGKSGTITMDGLNLSTVSRDTICNSVTCITQDPFLFTGTVRLNLDPSSSASDEDLEGALRRVGLWEAIQGRGESTESVTYGLDMQLDDLHLSQGQSQLFCMARALLRNRKVVLLDEPTSSVNDEVDIQIQEIIAKEFPSSTLLMVTHRLSGIGGFDKVVVLDGGALVEYGSPTELLNDTTSALSKLYKSQNHGTV